MLPNGGGLKDVDVIIIGAGLSGCVMANRFAEELKKRVLILERRDHIGGNCYDYVNEYGIRVNKYGAHIFHTNSERVWTYVNRFCEWKPWEHKVLGRVDEMLVPIPVNITTVNMLCDQNITTRKEMDTWLHEHQVPFETIQNSEEMALSRVGSFLYQKIFRNYTFKQWGQYPDELSPEVLARIPVRNTWDDRYFEDRYQALPAHGYTYFFEQLLQSPLIQVRLNIDFFEYQSEIVTSGKIIIYTGPIDSYFRDLRYEPLEYRSINFVSETYIDTEFYQPVAVMNYPGVEVEFTRIVEYKHFLHQSSPHTTIVKEYSTNTGEPYYPVLNSKNLELYARYQRLAETEPVHFLGRLANYRYFNMDQAIENALEYFDRYFQDN
jgi:UDP-galactopyranose mutase